MTYKNGYRHVALRYDIVRNGSIVGQLQPVSDCTVTMIADAELKSYLRGSFMESDIFDPLNDLIRPMLILDGIASPVGEYLISVSEKAMHGAYTEDSIEAYDKSLILSQNRLEKRVSFPAGALYIDVIQSMLVECGITMTIAEASDATLATAREDWEVGTSYLTVVNDLLTEINYDPLWFDNEGIARLKKQIQPSASNIVYTYKADALSILSAEATSTLDIYNAPNVFIVEVSNPDLPEPMRATSVNEDPGSILSTIRRGRRIVAPLERLDNIASQEALQEYADNKRLQSMLSTDTIVFTTALEPGHGVGDVIAIQHPDFSGIYQETEWEIPLSPGGLMRHKARRIVYL